VAEWRSGWQPSLCIAGEPYHHWRGTAWSSESGVPEEVPLRVPSRVLAPSPRGSPSDWTSKCDPYGSGGNGKDSAVQPNGGRVSRSTKNLGEDILASRADPAPHETDESRDGSRQSLRVNGFKDSKRTDRGHLAPIIQGIRQKSAQNSENLSERRRRPLFGWRAIRKNHLRGDPAIPLLANPVSHRSDHLSR